MKDRILTLLDAARGMVDAAGEVGITEDLRLARLVTANDYLSRARGLMEDEWN